MLSPLLKFTRDNGDVFHRAAHLVRGVNEPREKLNGHPDTAGGCILVLQGEPEVRIREKSGDVQQALVAAMDLIAARPFLVAHQLQRQAAGTIAVPGGISG